jgi:hypothetical protein
LPSSRAHFAGPLRLRDLLWIGGGGTMRDVVPEFTDLEGATTREGR